MTQLLWDQAGKRVYEAGVDRAVLYLPGEDGVPWNGLISVAKNVAGGETSEYHLDGNKYLDLVANEDFQATIKAFTYPEEFEKCDGTQEPHPGLLVPLQPRVRFGLCYRTLIGNDVSGIDYGYKIHLIYNALASPSEKVHTTVADGVDLSDFSWTINAVPEVLPGFKPVAHLVIDSRNTDPLLLQSLEDTLYGDSDSDSRLPLPAEIMERYSNWGSTITILDNGDGTWTAIGPDELITMTDSETFQITGVDATYLDADTYNVGTTD